MEKFYTSMADVSGRAAINSLFEKNFHARRNNLLLLHELAGLNVSLTCIIKLQDAA